MPTLTVPEWETTQSLIELARQNVFRVEGSRKTYQIVLDFCHGSLIHHARNQMVDPGLSTKDDNTWWDYVLFVDSDMTWELKWVLELAMHELPVVGGICVTKSFPYKPTIFKYQEETGVFVNAILNPKLFGAERPAEQRLLKVDGIGTGFTMIKRSVIEAIKPPWFWFSLEPLKNNPEKKQAFGEDVYFCKQCREAGIEVYCDLDVRPGHIGKYTYTLDDHIHAMTASAHALAQRQGIEDESDPRVAEIVGGLHGVNPRDDVAGTDQSDEVLPSTVAAV